MQKHRIGQRIIKTSIAVFISISIHIILLYFDRKLGIDRNLDWHAPSNMYTPFFAGIAAVYATHKDRKSSFQQAKIRSFGSIIGGYFGMALIMLTEYVLIDILNMESMHYIMFTFLKYLIVAIGIIPLIWITVSLKQNAATFITCLTYLSVTISIRNGGMPVFQFATNRVISTLVGVAIALIVNNIHKFKKRNQELLFVTSLENNFLVDDKGFSLYVKYKFNNLYYHNMPLVVSTERSLSSLEYIFDDVEVTYPMVVMNGASIYNFKDNTYQNIYNIKQSARVFIDNIISKYNVDAFRYSINDGIMHCYYEKIQKEPSKFYYNLRKRNLYDNFVYATLPADAEVALYTIIDEYEVLDLIMEEIKESYHEKEVDFVISQYNEVKGDYYMLEINSHKAKKEYLVNHIKENNNFKKMIVCGSSYTDIPLLQQSDLSICLESAPDDIKREVDIILENNPEKILKLFDRIYNSFTPNYLIKRLKKKYYKTVKRYKK